MLLVMSLQKREIMQHNIHDKRPEYDNITSPWFAFVAKYNEVIESNVSWLTLLSVFNKRSTTLECP